MALALPDYPDFAKPVAGIEIVNNANLPGGGLTAIGASARVGTAGFKSVLITFTPPLGLSGQRYVLTAKFIDLTLPSHTDSMSFHSRASYSTQPSTFYWQFPVRGAVLELTLNGDVGAFIAIAVLGSNRDIQGETVTTDATSGGPQLLDTGAVNVAAGAGSASFAIPPVSRAASIWFNSAGHPAHFDLSAVCAPGGVMSSLFRNTSSIAGSNANTFEGIPLPGVGTELVMRNDDTVARNLHAIVWDVS